MGDIVFGTDGWRAVIAEDFTFDRVALVAAAIADYVKAEQEKKGKMASELTLAVGGDSRFLSAEFAECVACTLAARGVKALLSRDFVATPALSFGVVERKTMGGVMITASHNPARYNGIKFKGDFGGSAPSSMVREVESHLHRLMDSGEEIVSLTIDEALEKGLVERTDFFTTYIEAVKAKVDLELISKSGLKVIADPMHGSGMGYLKSIFDDIGLECEEIRGEFNPSFGGYNPEPMGRNVEPLIQRIKETGADIGLATDGDADRIGIVDESGTYITTQIAFALLLMHLVEDLKQTGKVAKAATSSSMIDILCEQYGIELIETEVGFKSICERMLAEDVMIGGEESGGYGVRGHVPERDGILMALYVLEMMAMRGKPLSEIVQQLFERTGFFTYNRIDMHTTMEIQDEAWKRIEQKPSEFAGNKVERISEIDGYKFFCGDGSWVMTRRSGTEPIIRIYCEARSEEQVKTMLADARQKFFGGMID